MARYQLSFLLDLRRREREALEMEIGRLAALVAAWRGRGEAAKKSLFSLGTGADGVLSGRSQSEDWHNFGVELESTRAGLSAAEREESRYRRELDLVRGRYIAARAREKTLEKHRDRLHAEWRADQERKACHEADDRAGHPRKRPFA